MRKIVDYKVEYWDGEREREVTFKIKRIPQSVLTEYSELSQTINRVFKMSQQLNTVIETMGDLVFNRDPDAKEKIADLKEEKKNIEDELKQIDSRSFFDRRHALIKKLLEKNGINDERYLSRSFWEDDVDTTILNGFLESVVYKDFDTTKKKAV